MDDGFLGFVSLVGWLTGWLAINPERCFIIKLTTIAKEISATIRNTFISNCIQLIAKSNSNNCVPWRRWRRRYPEPKLYFFIKFMLNLNSSFWSPLNVWQMSGLKNTAVWTDRLTDGRTYISMFSSQRSVQTDRKTHSDKRTYASF